MAICGVKHGNVVTAQGRVAKRSRKLIDYDSARHHVETLQMSGMKNDRKMIKVSSWPRRMRVESC